MTIETTTIIRGTVMEVGSSEESGAAFVRLERGNTPSDITIDGLTDDEARDIAKCFFQEVSISIRRHG